MPEPSDSPLAYEALTTKGLKELSCGCVLYVKRKELQHLRKCRQAERIYRALQIVSDSPRFSLNDQYCPGIYNHFAKHVLT